MKSTGIRRIGSATKMDELVRRYAGKTKAELIVLFRASRQAIVEQIMAAAAIVRVFDGHDWDVGQLGVSARDLHYLRRVAYNETLPELLMSDRFAGALASRVARLPLPQQRDVVQDKPVEVVTGATCRLIRPSELTPAQVLQVFTYDRMRTAAEQRSYLEERAAQQPQHPTDPGPVVIDGGARCIYVTGCRVRLTARDLAEYLARLSA